MHARLPEEKRKSDGYLWFAFHIDLCSKILVQIKFKKEQKVSSGDNGWRWRMEINGKHVNAAPSALKSGHVTEEEQDNLKPDANTATEGDLRRRRSRLGMRKRSVR